ncbi:MAG: oligosaccharide flippase family protein [Deltaproteobacteria bacterium]|nr:oligosaccharide flippase family protein [Deltaproteobacteria bacterium]
MRIPHRIVLNTITTWTALAVNVIVSFILVPFLLYHIGIEGYGLIALTWALISFSIFADFGISTSLSRNLSEQIARKNTSRFNELLSSGFLIYLIIGSTLALTVIFFATSLSDMFKVSIARKYQAVFLIQYFAGPVIFISFINSIFGSILSSNNRFDLINAINTGTSIFRGLGILLVLSFTDTDLYGWIFVSLASKLIFLISLYVAARRVWPGFHIHIRYVKIDVLKNLFSTGRYIFLQQISSIFRFKINPIILSVFLGPAAAALYKPAENISTTTMPLVSTLAAQLFPLATGYHVTGNTEKMKAILLRGTKYIFLLAIPICVMLIVYSKPIIKIWLGRSIEQHYLITASVLFFMAITDMFYYAGGTQGIVLLGMNRLKFVSIMSMIFTILNFGAVIFLVGYTSIGIIGVIIPAVFTDAVFRIIITIHVARQCHLSMKQYLIESYLRPFIVFFILCAAAVILRMVVVPEKLLSLILCALCIALIWIILSWTIGFDCYDKKELIDLSASTWKKTVKRSSVESNS